MNNPKRILIACGGTGGHLAPGIALAQRLQAQGHGCQLLISSKQVDKRLIQNYPQLTFHGLKATALKGGIIGKIKALWHQFTSLLFCLKLITKYKPTAVVGFGGFITFSAGVAARLTRTPLLLHEANHRVGRVVRLLAKSARKVYLPEGINKIAKSVPVKKVVYANTPLRSDLEKISKDEARRLLGFPTRGKLIFVTGGSQGASSINQWALDHEKVLLENGIHLYCLTGPLNDLDRTTELQLPLGQLSKSVFAKFSDKMHLLYAAADLVIARAGAGTITELVHFEKPSILIPLPFAADDHQRANAAHLERLGGCVVLEQTQLENLSKEALYMLKSSSLCEAIASNLRKLHTTDPCEVIIDEIRTLKTSVLQKRIEASKQASAQRLFLELLSKADPSLAQHRIIKEEPLGPKTTFGIGGAARLYAEPESLEELTAIYKAAHAAHLPLFAMGRGSNLLVLSSGFEGLVIRLNKPYWQKIDLLPNGQIKAAAGVRLKTLAGQMARQGLGGFEFMEGIPATVGGAVRTNPGAFKGSFFNKIYKIQLLTPSGKIIEKRPSAFKASYRKVLGHENTIALSVTFKPAVPVAPEKIKQTMEEYQTWRKARQPREASAGSVFKNPTGTFAGKLIEDLGLKGLSVGGSSISTLHANFIINKADATSEDVINLINIVRQKVYKDKKIVLEPEIMLLGGRWNDYLLPLEV